MLLCTIFFILIFKNILDFAKNMETKELDLMSTLPFKDIFGKINLKNHFVFKKYKFCCNGT